jgi:hypothetical protein
MVRMMARENREEWGTSARVELETVRAVIAAYGRGEITLPEVPKNTKRSELRDVALMRSDPEPATEEAA